MIRIIVWVQRNCLDSRGEKSVHSKNTEWEDECLKLTLPLWVYEDTQTDKNHFSGSMGISFTLTFIKEARKLLLHAIV